MAGAKTCGPMLTLGVHFSHEIVPLSLDGVVRASGECFDFIFFQIPVSGGGYRFYDVDFACDGAGGRGSAGSGISKSAKWGASKGVVALDEWQHHEGRDCA